MKYSEFREYSTFYNIPLKEDEDWLIADNRFEISKTEERRIVFLIDNIQYPYEYKMLKEAIELAETPLDEREEEKKYYIKFTKAEIEEFKKKFDTDLNDFEFVEVED